MNMRLYLKGKILIGFIILINLCNSQINEVEVHKKYWYYKTRFNNDFIKVGIKQGESIPFNQRGAAETGANVFPNYSPFIKAGDATAQLGIYMGVLATEYRLLKDKGQNLDKIKHELYCALNAFNRIDYFTEKYIHDHPHPNNPKTTSQPNLNGFFMRDDIPAYFIDSNYTHFNYFNDSSKYQGGGNPNPSFIYDKGFTQFFQHGFTKTASDFQNFNSKNSPQFNWDTGDDPVLHGKEESQDQLYYLLMGTALVSKLVDAGETDNNTNFDYGSGQADIRQEAINIADRLLKHVGNNLAWAIKNPVNNNKNVQIGDVALPYAYALDNLGCFVKYNQDFPSYAIGFGPTVSNNCTDYRNASSFFATAWNGIAIGLNGGAKVDMQGFYHALAGTCNCIMEDKTFKNLAIQALITYYNAQIQIIYNNAQEIISKLPSWAQTAIAYVVAYTNQLIGGLLYIIDQLQLQLIDIIKVNTTEERLIFNTYLNTVEYNNCTSTNPAVLNTTGSKMYFGVPLWRVLHPNPASLPNWVQLITGNISPFFYSNIKQDLESILNEAPCEGTYNFFGNTSLNYPVPDSKWASPNRLDRMDPVYKHNTCPTAFLGEYNGLDYMLLHNLYYLAEGASSTIDYSDRRITLSMPFNSYFSSSNKNTVGGYEYIKGYNIINNNGAADYRAGKEIALLPNGNSGFSAISGSDFHAYISPFKCENGTYNGEMLRNSENAPIYDGQLDKPSENKQTKNESFSGPLELNHSNYQDEINAIIDSLNKFNYSIMPLEQKIELFPNPSNGVFSISLSLSYYEKVHFKITDVNGRTVLEEKDLEGYQVKEIDLKNQPKGVYMAVFNSDGGQIYSKKVIIN